MNKKELVAALAKRTGLTQAKSAEVVNALFEAENGSGIIVGAVQGGAKVTIPGFGTFALRKRAERTATSPSVPGQKITVPPRAYVTFKSGKTLRELVSGNGAAS